MKFFRSSFLPRTEIKKGNILKMQLSTKASSVVLNSFTNAHSSYWHSSFQHLHTHFQSYQAPTLVGYQSYHHYHNHDTKSCASSHNLLFGLRPPLPCLHLPIPSLWHCLEQQLCHPAFCSNSTEAKPCCSAFLHCQYPPSSLAECQGSITPSWAQQYWERPGWRKELAWG